MNLFNLRRPAPSLDDLILEAKTPALRDDLSSDCLMPSVALSLIHI